MELLKWFREKFKNLNLFYKFQIALFIVSMVSLTVMGYYGYNQGKEQLTERSFDLLISLTENKRKSIEGYFQTLKNQISILAETPSTRDALNELVEGFTKYSPADSERADSSLRRFYQKNFFELWQYNTLQKETKGRYIPQAPQGQALQLKYLVDNPNPINYKYRMNSPAAPNQAEKYDATHLRYHPSFVKLVQKFELADILLIDKKGNVVYTMAKKVDFAQNFKTSPLRNTNLGELYRQLMLSHNEDPVIFKDYESYPADLGAPACFMGVPIYEPRLNRAERGEKVGTLIFQVSNEKITNLLTNNLNWAGESLGTTGEIAMVGPDYLLRNNTRRFLEDPTFYYNNLLRSTGDTAVVEKIRRQKTTILLRKYQNQSSVQAINGKNGHFQTTDFLGSEVLDVYMPMNILGTRWAMICEMDGAEMFQSTIVFRNQLLIVGVIVFVFITILGAYLAKSLADPMRKIQKEVTMLSEGIFPKITTHIYNDELGKIDEAMNKLISNMREVATFAENIGRENFDFPFTPKNNQDILGNALLSMRDSLKTLSIAEHQRGWVSTGKALFAELLRKHNDSLDAMGNVIIAELIKYIGANQGAFFLQDDQTKQLRILSAYAYDRRKYLHKALQPGEGLVGQVFLERSRIYLTEIPEDYVDITSGLGHARPRCILVIPVQANRQIYGVIELASFDYLEDYKLEFVESVGEDIALTITNLKTTEETKRLLQESQKITQQLRQQEEEMRQNFEELLATQDEMRERYGKLDELLHGKITLEEMQENGDWVGDFQLDEYGMDKKVKDAILRQKTLLDEAYTKNQLREQIIRNKVENTNGNQQ